MHLSIFIELHGIIFATFLLRFHFRTNCLLTLATHDHVDVYMKNNDGIVGLNDSILKEEGKKNGNMRSFYNRLRFFLEHSKS